VLDDRARAEEPDSRDHVGDDARGVEHDADVVPEVEAGPGEVADDDEERRAEPDEHVRAQPGLMVSKLALEPDRAGEHDYQQQSRDTFPER
jgi:hypothetical protein